MIHTTHTILITGGSSGIGAATARMLAADGMTVYAASRRGTIEGSDFDGRIIPVKLDVNDEALTIKAVNDIVEKHGTLDAVVVNAGNGIAGSVEDSDDEEVRYQFETCCFGALKTIRACMEVFRKQGYGRVITITSVAAIVPLPYQGIYSGVKAAMLSITENLRMETSHLGDIQFCSVLPGDVRTEFTCARKIVKKAATSPYADEFQRAMKVIEKDETTGMSADIIARAVLRQLRRRRMSVRVIPRIDYALVGLLMRLIPECIKLPIIKALYR